MVSMSSATTTLAALGEWSSPLFTEFLEPALIVVGMLFGVMLLIFIWQGLSNIFENIGDKAYAKKEFEYETDMGDWYQQTYGPDIGLRKWERWQNKRHRPRKEDYFDE